MKLKYFGVLMLLIILACGCGKKEKTVEVTEEKSVEPVITDAQDENPDKDNQTNSGVSIDEILIDDVQVSVVDTNTDSITCKYKIKNCTDNKITFENISITEIDENGDILADYQSSNKNYVPTELKSGQSIYIDIVSERNGLAEINIKEYEYTNDKGNRVSGNFSDLFVININEFIGQPKQKDVQINDAETKEETKGGIESNQSNEGKVTVKSFIEGYNDSVTAFNRLIHIDKVNSSGEFEIGNEITIDINPNENVNENSIISIVNIQSLQFNKASSDLFGKQLFCYLNGINPDFTEDELITITDKIFGDEENPVMNNLEFNIYNIGEVVIIQTKINQ